jgi:hypothetical protein
MEDRPSSKADMQTMARILGAKGGRARARRLTKAQLREIAMKGVKARREKRNGQ